MSFVKVCQAVIVTCGACPGLDPGRQISQYTVRSWTQAQGLPQDSVRALAQTPDGHLWVGTDEGLARFDGYAFTSVPPNDLPSTAIRALCSASDGTLWIGTASGIATHRHRDLPVVRVRKSRIVQFAVSPQVRTVSPREFKRAAATR